MPDSVLKTADQVIDALGGTFAVARLCSVVPSAVSNWRKNDRIAGGKYLIMMKALERQNLSARDALWGQVETARARRAR